ncbi:glycosyltransferase family 2 protein [Grimontia sp. NTOU-MAR1]|uniref:glycosyltransferase family 2 protein n=1 Tax=Grimontia sp. NTOU-MAR1 TaxID=3111011 RepID=UPI002DB8C171|nr:glycosyltransferase [Grimontia sp. NTOU-MAR1]WRV97513.1 glycosyltransferase [Grimontia sp. NTOU-MAR1]
MVNVAQPKIAVVLNAYKRTKYLELQLDAIDSQTVKAENIYLWQNKGEIIPDHLKSRFIHAECSENLGVWARFAYALNIDAEYICVFDDDTIPGPKWFENCLKTMETHEGLLGTRGLRFLSTKRYHPFEAFGWGDTNEGVEQVDIVGHAWFFKREWLAAFWSELPPTDASKIAGEDIHFSYMIQKKLGLATYVPPHPADDESCWGSLPKYGKKLGMDSAAISSSQTALNRFDIALQYYTKNGFKLCKDMDVKMQKGVVIGAGVRKIGIVRKITNRYPKLHALGGKILNLLAKAGIHI